MGTRLFELSIVVAGALASGKTSVAKGIARHLDCPVTSFGRYIRARALEIGLPEDRASLQAFGASLVESDPASFTSGFLESISVTPSGRSVVIEGLRHVSVAQALREIRFSNRLLIVLVKTTDAERKRRFVARGDGSEAEFSTADRHLVESEHIQLEYIADIVLNGDQPLDAVVHELAAAIGAVLPDDGATRRQDH